MRYSPLLSPRHARSIGRDRLLFIALLILGTTRSEAHLVQTGFGTFYDGIAHLLITPSDLMVTVGFALLAGLLGKPAVRRVMFALPGCWLAAGFLGMHVPAPAYLSWMATLLVMGVGLLIALSPRIPPWSVATLAGLSGILHGWINGSTMTPQGSDQLALVGAVATVFVMVTLIGALVVDLRAHWARIVVRVAGSWIVAINLLMLGWLAKGMMN